MQTVIRNALIVMQHPNDYNARAEIMWAGSLSHNGLTDCGCDHGDWATHKMEHELGGLFDVAHGAGLAAIWGSWARYVCDADYARFARFATKLLNVAPQATDKETALAGIDAMEQFYHSIQMPTSLRELGISPTEEQLQEMARKCILATNGPAGKVKPLHQNDVENIYRAAL